MSVLSRSKEQPAWDIYTVKDMMLAKLGPYEPPMSRLDVLNWINSFTCSTAAKKVGRVSGYKDQWFVGAWLEESAGRRLYMHFCQGRNVGRITQNGAYNILVDISDCDNKEEIDFKFNLWTLNQKETQDTIKANLAGLVFAMGNKDEKEFRKCVKRLHWMDFELETWKGKSKMSQENEIQVMQEKCEIALKNGATPSLKVCEELRNQGPEQAKWLDDTYLKYKRPELVGDDKDGLCALLKSEGYLRKAIEKCKADEVVYWFRIIKGLDPLPDSVRESAIKAAEENA